MIWKSLIAIPVAFSVVLSFSSSYVIRPENAPTSPENSQTYQNAQEAQTPSTRRPTAKDKELEARRQHEIIVNALFEVKNGRTIAILRDLIDCESRGNPNALNPKDLDQTASYGLLQFKPQTLYSFGKKYGIIKDMESQEIMNVIYDPVLQIKVAGEMIKEYGHLESFWRQQFPQCSSKYGYWNRKTVKNMEITDEQKIIQEYLQLLREKRLAGYPTETYPTIVLRFTDFRSEDTKICPQCEELFFYGKPGIRGFYFRANKRFCTLVCYKRANHRRWYFRRKSVDKDSLLVC